MIVKKYRLNLKDRYILCDRESWLTYEEYKKHRGGFVYAHWQNDREFLTIDSLINYFEEYFDISFPNDFDDYIEKVEYNVPEGKFIITECYQWTNYRFHRKLFRYCESVSDVLNYLDIDMETYRIVGNQFKLEKPLTTLYVLDDFGKRSWNY